MELTKIKQWLDEMGITGYTIRPDGIVDVGGNVDLTHFNGTKLPVQFGKVTGYFNSSIAKITSLAGCPQSVGGSFWCSSTNILNLLRFFAIKHMRSVNTGIAGIDDIINKYLVGDRQINMIYAQDELIDAGFGKQAKW